MLLHGSKMWHESIEQNNHFNTEVRTIFSTFSSGLQTLLKEQRRF